MPAFSNSTIGLFTLDDLNVKYLPKRFSLQRVIAYKFFCKLPEKRLKNTTVWVEYAAYEEGVEVPHGSSNKKCQIESSASCFPFKTAASLKTKRSAQRKTLS